MKLKNTYPLFECNIGIEQESLRVDKNAFIVQTPHPFPNDPEIKMDFAENQIEIASRQAHSPQDAYNRLLFLRNKVKIKIAESGELLWCCSNPPLFNSEADIKIADFPNDREETEFRENLALKYGRRVMLYSGIHYNFSFSDNLIKTLFSESGESDYKNFKNGLYLSTAKNCFKYIWFPVYLTAASPVFDSSFMNGRNLKSGTFRGYSSMRNSPFGYKNRELVTPDYSSCENYVQSIRSYVKAKKLMHISELYSPVRIKAKSGHTTTALLNEGIDFLELRVFDLNPFDPAAFALDDIIFTQLFMIYMLSLDDFDFSPQEQKLADENRFQSAVYDIKKALITTHGTSETLDSAAKKFAENMTLFYHRLGAENAVRDLERTFKRVYNPSHRYAYQLLNSEKKYAEYYLELSK